MGGIAVEIRLVNIGFGNMVSANRLIAVISPESAPVKRIVSEARSRGNLLDATFGRKTRAVLVMDSGHIVLSAIHPETVANRLGSKEERHREDHSINHEDPTS